MSDFKADASQVTAARDNLAPLIQEAIERRSLGATNYVINCTDTIDCHSQSACHSNISYPTGMPICVATELATRRRQAVFGDPFELTEGFRGFLVTDNMWAPYIVDSSDDHITIDASAPQNVLQALMISSRLVWEATRDSFQLFDEAVSRGLPRRVAFVYSFHSTLSSRDYSSNRSGTESHLKPGDTVGSVQSHRPWDLLGRDGLRKYLGSNFQPTAPYYEYHETTGVRGMFGHSKLIPELFDDSGFRNRLATFRQSREKEEGSAIPNPFAVKTDRQPSQTPRGVVTVSEYRNVVLDQLVEDFATKEEVRNV